VSLARGELLAPWEDDDISLPHRLELARERLGNRDYFNPRRYWYLNDQGLHAEEFNGVGHNLSLFRRRAWQAVGGYPTVTGSQDAEMDGRLVQSAKVSCRVDEEPLHKRDWYYIYRWGVSPCHLSGAPDMQGFYDSLELARTAAGRFVLEPHWRQDYPAMVAAAIAKARETLSAPDSSARPGCDTAYKRAAAFLSGVGLIEDWRCGSAYFKRFVPAGCYRGVDQAPSPHCDIVADLGEYKSEADGILLRHVLERDRRWRQILRHALASCRRRMVLVVSTPFVRATEEQHIRGARADGELRPEIRFARGDLVRELAGLSFRLEENIATDSPFGREHVFYVAKDGPA
jgi:hypothetical protein